jgi:hypothetical protein
MQSLHIPSDRWAGPRAGQQKLNGKLHKLCSCGCCECINFKPQVEVKEKNKEIIDFRTTQNIGMREYQFRSIISK